jgi:hypothetical protein
MSKLAADLVEALLDDKEIFETSINQETSSIMHLTFSFYYAARCCFERCSLRTSRNQSTSAKKSITRNSKKNLPSLRNLQKVVVWTSSSSSRSPTFLLWYYAIGSNLVTKDQHYMPFSRHMSYQPKRKLSQEQMLDMTHKVPLSTGRSYV